MSCRHEWLEDENEIFCSQCSIRQTPAGVDESYDTLREANE
jgi:hypothetical protein